MSVILGFFTRAVTFVFGTIFRGIASILVMGLATWLWGKVSLCRGRYPARPATILFFPLVASGLLALFLLSFVLRLTLFALPAAFVAALAGAGLGLIAGGRTHLSATRWGRVMIVSRGRHLDLWFASLVLALFFRILPWGWLSTPTMALLVFSTALLVVDHVVLYARYKAMEAAVYGPVPGAPIDLSLAPPEAAIVACLTDLWAAHGDGAVGFDALAGALRAGERLRGDAALALLPGVRRAWANLAANPTVIGPVVQGLVERGVLAAGLRPGPALARLLLMGSFARTVSLGGGPIGPGVGAPRVAVVAQAGGTNLLFEATADRVSLREARASEMARSIGAVLSA